MQRVLKIAEVVATLLAFGTVGTVAFLANDIHRRLDALEAQVQVIATAPAITRPGDNAPVPNPIAQACADLSIRAAQAAIEGKTIIGVPETKKIMDELGCRGLAVAD